MRSNRILVALDKGKGVDGQRCDVWLTNYVGVFADVYDLSILLSNMATGTHKNCNQGFWFSVLGVKLLFYL